MASSTMEGLSLSRHQRSSSLKATCLHLLAIAIVGMVVYSNTFQAPFVFDDLQQIEENMKIRRLSDCLSLKQLFSPRPIAELSFALNYRIGGLNVFGYHLVNLVIHIVNGFLVYYLILLFFARLSRGRFQGQGHLNDSEDSCAPTQWVAGQCETQDHEPRFSISLMALCAALIFIAHPLQTQAVTYIVQRHASMAAMFYLLSVYLYMKARGLQQDALSVELNSLKVENKAPGLRITYVSLYAICFLCGVLAFLTKQNTATLPWAILLVEYILFDRTWQGWKQKLVWCVPAFFLIGLFILYVSGLFKGGIQFGGLLEDVSGILRASQKDLGRWVYFCTQLNVLVIYIRLLFLPIGQNLDYMYPFKTGFFDGYTPVAFLFLASLVGVAIWQLKKRPAVSFGIFWFFITLSIESSFFPITDAMFEHRLYLPMFGFAIAISYIVWSWIPVRQIWRIAISFFIISMLGGTTYLRNKTYESKLKMWSDVASKSPQNVRAHYNLGNALYKKGRSYDAIKSYSEALRIQDDYVLAHLNLGVVLTETGKLDDAIRHLSKAERMRPNDAQVHINLGNALMASGRLQDALQHLSKAVHIAPGSAEAHNNLGIALAKQGNLKDATGHFLKAAAIEPRDAKIHTNLGQAFMVQGDMSKAAEHYAEAIRIDPAYADAHLNLGVMQLHEGDIDQAIKHLSEALKLRPGLTQARVQLDRAMTLRGLRNPAHRK